MRKKFLRDWLRVLGGCGLWSAQAVLDDFTSTQGDVLGQQQQSSLIPPDAFENWQQCCKYCIKLSNIS